MFNWLKFIFRRKAAIAFFFLLSSSFVVYKAFFLKPAFETEAILVVGEADKPVELGTEELDISRTISIIKRHKAKLESREIMGEVLNKLLTAEKSSLQADGLLKELSDPQKPFDLSLHISNQSLTDEGRFTSLADKIRERHIKVEEIPFTDFIKIKASANDPQSAALLANTLCQVYIDWVLKFEKEEYTEKANFIQQQLTRTKATLNEFEEKLEQYKNKEGLTSVPGDSRDKSEAANLLVAGNELEKQIRELSDRIKGLYANFATGAFKIEELKQSLRMKSNLRYLGSLFLQKVELEMTYTEEYPPLQDINALINPVESCIKESLLDILKQKVPLNSENASSLTELEQLFTRYFVADAHLQAVNRMLSQIDQKQWVVKEKYLPFQEREIADINREIDLQGTLYKDLLLKKQQLDLLTSRKAPESVRVFSRAPIPDHPKKSALLILLIGFIFSMILSLIGATFIELAQSDMYDFPGLADYFGIPLLGVVPYISNILNFDIDDLNRRNPYQLICACLQRKAVFQTFQITSARKGEGKTITAINLAKTFSISGQDVLLIETSPVNTITFEEYFKLKGLPGLWNVCSENVPLEKAIYHTDFDRVSIMPFGRQTTLKANGDYPSQFRSRAKEMIRTLTKHYQIIIFDTCSLDYSYDPLFIGQIVDHSIFLISAADTNKAVALHGKNLLAEGGIKLSGFILNDVRHAIPHSIYKAISKFKLN